MKKLLSYKKVLSFILVVALMVSNISVSVIALDKNSSSDNNIPLEESTINSVVPIGYQEDKIESISEEQLKTILPGEKTLSELSKMTVDIENLPVFINSTTALQKGHVNRVEEQEKNLNTVVYQNTDGSKTTYIFKNPVKYIDDEGNIRDKSSLIDAFDSKDYKYAATDNIVKTYFPTQSTVGTKIDFHHFSIITTPISKNTASPIKINDNTIKYEGVFGDSTSIVYYTELNGIKEDIVLSKNIGQNEFRFDLSVSNLIPFESNGIWYLKDSEQKIVGSFGKIIVSDAEGKTIEGTMNIVPTTQKGKYVITVVVPIEFLNAKSTVYPVCIDPSTYIVETGSYYYIGESGYEEILFYNAIEDTGLYSTQSGADNALNNPDYHRLGRYNSVDGKIVYKLYDFFGEYGQYKDLKPYQIGSVQLHINVNSGSSATLSVNQMLSTWDDSVVGEDPVAIYDNSLWNFYSIDNEITFNLPAASGRYSIDITDIVKGWAGFNSGEPYETYNNPALGFVLSSNSTSSSRNVTAVEELSSANSVYITMDTSYIGGDFYINNIISGQFLRKNGEIAVTTSLYADTTDIQWQFEYIGNDNYYIRSSSTNDVLYAFENTLSLASLPAEDPPNYYIWEVKAATGGGVTIKNVGNGYVIRYDGTALSLSAPIAPGDSTYKQTVWGVVAKDSYVNLTDFEISDDWLLPNSNKYFYVEANANWSANSCFTWSIVSNGRVGQNIFTVDQNGQIYASQAGGTATLTVTHKMTGLSKSFIIKSGELRDGTYSIMNNGINAFIAVDTNSDATVPHFESTTVDQTKWEVKLSASGFYSIKSVYSGKWLKAGSSTDPNAIVQYTSSVTQSAKWYITKTSSGCYKITPLSDESVVISMLSNASAFALASYSANNYYMCEWIFDNVGETHGITNGGVYTIEATNTNKVFTAEEGKTEAETDIIQNTRSQGKQSQRWKFIHIGNGEYKIKDIKSGKLLSISDNSMFDSACAMLKDDDGSSGQIFKIKENTDDGSYSIYSKCSYYYYALSVPNNDPATDDKIRQSNQSSLRHIRFDIVESNNAIIIVPGFGGSVLQMRESSSTQESVTIKEVFSGALFSSILKLPNAISGDINDLLTTIENAECIFDVEAIMDEFFPQIDPATVDGIRSVITMLYLMCDSNGESYCDIVPKEFDAYEFGTGENPENIENSENLENSEDPSTPVDEKYGAWNIYQPLFQNMVNVVSEDGPYNGYDVTFFAYDWRMSCADSASKLDQFIERYEYDNVVLVCHSLGGLVGSGYMARGTNQLNKVEKYISLGTPHWGTTIVPTICLIGEVKFFFGEKNLVEGEASIGDMILQDLVRDGVVRHILSNIPSIYEAMPTQKYVEATGGYLSYDQGTLCTTYSETKNVIASHMEGYKASLMESAEDFHNSLYTENNQHITSLNNNSMYVYSDSIKTVQWLTYDPELLGIYFRYSYSWNKGGDSIVPTVSASMNGSSKSKRKPVDHMGLATLHFQNDLTLEEDNQNENQ